MTFSCFAASCATALRAALAVVVLTGLAACATVMPYQPAAQSGAHGFAETRLEPNRYALTFAGNTNTPREQVENAALYRAAELTLAAGFQHFIVAARATDADSRTVRFGPRSTWAFDYWGFDPRFGWRPYVGSHWGPGWRDPFRDDFDIRTYTSFKARLEFVMAAGAKPAVNPHAFDAAAIIVSLDSKIVRPVAK